MPVSGSGSDTTFGAIRLRRKLPLVLWRALCVLCDFVSVVFRRCAECAGRVGEDILGETYPTPLETILRTEEAILDPQLETCWALQSTSIVFAVNTDTFPRRGFGSHDRGAALAET